MGAPVFGPHSQMQRFSPRVWTNASRSGWNEAVSDAAGRSLGKFVTLGKFVIKLGGSRPRRFAQGSGEAHAAPGVGQRGIDAVPCEEAGSPTPRDWLWTPSVMRRPS